MSKHESRPKGTYVRIENGVRAYVPPPLPRRVDLSGELVTLLEAATQRAATLSGIGEVLPNPHLLIRPFVSREAVLSSRIEGTQTMVGELFMHEASPRIDEAGDAREVTNYLRALEHGLADLGRLPVSVRLLNGMHRTLMEGVRGGDRRPGELRRTQVFVGTRARSISDAAFVPPPARLVRDLLLDLERFANEDLPIPILVRAALLHHQFETIHPYLDGNGRLGRLLVTLFLCEKRLLSAPLLYLSAYLERYRDEYYAHLDRVRGDGDWEPWLTFFLRGVAAEAEDAIVRSRSVLELHRSYNARLHAAKASTNALRLLGRLFENPYVTAPLAARQLGVTLAGARGIIGRIAATGIIEPVPGRWPQMYVARELLHVIEQPIATPTRPSPRRRAG